MNKVNFRLRSYGGFDSAPLNLYFVNLNKI